MLVGFLEKAIWSRACQNNWIRGLDKLSVHRVPVLAGVNGHLPLSFLHLWSLFFNVSNNTWMVRGKKKPMCWYFFLFKWAPGWSCHFSGAKWDDEKCSVYSHEGFWGRNVFKGSIDVLHFEVFLEQMLKWTECEGKIIVGHCGDLESVL